LKVIVTLKLPSGLTGSVVDVLLLIRQAGGSKRRLVIFFPPGASEKLTLQAFALPVASVPQEPLKLPGASVGAVVGACVGVGVGAVGRLKVMIAFEPGPFAVAALICDTYLVPPSL